MQKYQVFINNHSVTLLDNAKRNQQSDFTLTIYNPESHEIHLLIDYLKVEEKMVVNACLLGGNVKELWIKFQACFKMIRAAGGVVLNNKKQLLFIYRLDKWDLPKGKIELGEGAKKAALREVEEECGLSKLVVKEKLENTYHMYFHKGEMILKETLWYTMDYEGSENLVPQQEEGITEVVWLDLDKVGPKIQDTYASLRPVLKEFIANHNR